MQIKPRQSWDEFVKEMQIMDEQDKRNVAKYRQSRPTVNLFCAIVAGLLAAGAIVWAVYLLLEGVGK